jgi:MFS family permease
VALSLVHSLLTFYLAFLVLAIGSSLAGFMAVSASVANWFVRRRATAMGIAMAGMGVGGLLVPGLAWCLAVFGWRAVAFSSGIAVVVIGLPAAQLMLHRPEDHGYLPDGATPVGPRQTARSTSAVAASRNNEFTAMEAMRTSAFWLLAVGHAAALLVVGAVMVHLVSHTVEGVDLSLETAGMVIAVLTCMDIAGRLAGGFVGDQINKRVGVAGCLLGHAVALVVLAYAPNLPMVLLFSVIHGLAWGVRGPLLMALRADYFGRSSYGTITGFSSLIMMSGMVVGPILAGFMADRFGDYRMGFTILAGLAGLSSLLFLLAQAPTKPPVNRTKSDQLSQP